MEAPFRDAHNTTLRMNNLDQALREHAEHPLYDTASKLGEQIYVTGNGMALDLPILACHGDLKISIYILIQMVPTMSADGYHWSRDYGIEMGDALAFMV